MYETEKLWHPLLLKTVPDGSYLHSSDADISRGREEECRRRLAGEAMGGDCLFLRCLRSHHASTLPPFEKPLIAAIVQRGPNLTCGRSAFCSASAIMTFRLMFKTFIVICSRSPFPAQHPGLLNIDRPALCLRGALQNQSEP